MPTAALLGTGIAAPPRQIDNHRLARILETSDEWVRERTGVVTRRFAEAGVGSAELGAQAARAAIQDARIDPAEIDMLVCATMTPDHYFPGAGTLIQHKLGLKPTPALDLRQQCAGFAYGLQVVNALVRSGLSRTALLVGADVHTALMPFSKKSWEALYAEPPVQLDRADFEHNTRFRHLAVLFGDGAGAMVFRAQPDESRGILGGAFYGDGSLKDILFLPGVGSAARPFVDADMIAAAGHVPVMDGRAVYRLAATKMPEVTLEALAKFGLGLKDLGLLIPHQANLRINEAVQKSLGLPDGRVHNNIQEYGNTTSATLPICFHEARAAGKAPPGTLVAFTALGAGLHWGCALMRT